MNKDRLHELDWLRVLAFLLLIFFHAGMPFVTFGWHIKNAETSTSLSYLWSFFHNWRLPLLFMVSGAGIWFAMGERNGWGFLKERSLRLLLPLIFGVLVIVPPQVYLERLAQGATFDSYLDFYPHFFDGHFLNGGNFTPNHLWFIASLFYYCIVGLPLFLFFRSPLGIKVLDKLAIQLSKSWGIYLTTIPLYFALTVLKPYDLEYVFEFYQLVLVIIGFLIVSRRSIWETIEAIRFRSLFISVVGISCATYIRYSESNYADWIYFIPNVIGYFSLLLTFFGYGRYYLNKNNKFLLYTNEAVYPFYILHQTITVILAYFIVQWDINLWIKFTLTTTGTAVLTLGLYHLAIRPHNWVRPFFGLKQKSSNKKEMESVSQVNLSH
ncbi:acyltransferase family protein [Aliikangiella coralliicola]|uniref:Acyltransferase n=1 Tax=Aliikangiella coralliicola TaxID=2592383 RepID=A0A545UJ13_9GAMM|nr:acyltransferase [Aliikangiella coralliicola]TQV89457.1 acyltransferase [Aliikangiella coralliicola]